MADFLLLGTVELRGADGAVVDLGPAKQRTVLAALLVDAGRWVAVETLIDRVWGQELPAQVRTSLYAHIARIRRMLADTHAPLGTGTDDAGAGPQLRRGPGGYLLDVPSGRVDVHRFRQLVDQARGAQCTDAERVVMLREALGLWRGEPLAGLAGGWVQRTRYSWQQQRIEAVLAWADAKFRVGNHAEVIGTLTALVAEHPLVEPLTVALMRALQAARRSPEALACYTVLQKQLAEELGTDPGAEAQQVHQAILRGESAPPTAGGTRPPAEAGPGRAVPAQLPLETRGFTGRTEELTRLDGILAAAAERPAPVVISAVSGTAGVGKTALAVHWAHQVADRFPDGHLYVNLRGFGPSRTAMPPDQAVRGFLDALGVPPHRVPVDLQARVGLYRSLLAGRQVLVVLDNARDADQVRPLLPGSPSCLAIVTSRNGLTGLVAAEGAHPIALDLLSPAEAHDLLAHRLGEHRVAAEPDAVQEIITHCARLPLALAIVAARAATNPGFPLSAVAEELRDSHGSLDAFIGDDLTTDVRTVFSWSYHAQSAPAARLFHLLGLHSGPDISAPAAAALAGLPLRETRGLLVELTRAHLLTEYLPGRYTRHDLLRVYAAERVLTEETPQERDRAIERLLTWYLHTADAAYPLFTPDRPRVPLDPLPASCHPLAFSAYDQALDWCESERPNLVAAVRQAVSAGRPGIAWQLPAALWGFFYLRSHLQDWLDTTRTGLDAARDVHDRMGEAWGLMDVACALTQLHRYDEAIDHFRQAMVLCRELGNTVGRCQALSNLGDVYRRIGRPEKAVEYCRRALAVNRRLDYALREGNILVNLGDAYEQLGRFDEAIGVLEQALTVLRRIGDRWVEGIALDILGTAHHRLQRHDDAVGYFHQALDTHADIGNRSGEAHTLGNLGDVYLAAGDPDAARTNWQQALAILEKVDHPDAEEIRERLRRLEEHPPPPGTRSDPAADLEQQGEHRTKNTYYGVRGRSRRHGR
ncbi:AfsR/SARP family transcriptional regulator [Streptomyces sporangiiformans]|uniref:Tetratricopeptide repeat protein n=1 Tax=Streptomyces sporangiiformans TaxID=2315329 RepID=A0A505DA53_9ACTN|nr:tetratricopeptide repeat protein [Streptomyces sporangiiformans]TPQ21363.1 tetratricopeptide repeat protein [Streptomyces sporangiiformans]